MYRVSVIWRERSHEVHDRMPGHFESEKDSFVVHELFQLVLDESKREAQAGCRNERMYLILPLYVNDTYIWVVVPDIVCGSRAIWKSRVTADRHLPKCLEASHFRTQQTDAVEGTDTRCVGCWYKVNYSLQIRLHQMRLDPFKSTLTADSNISSTLIRRHKGVVYRWACHLSYPVSSRYLQFARSEISKDFRYSTRKKFQDPRAKNKLPSMNPRPKPPHM